MDKIMNGKVWRFGDAINYTEFESDGRMKMYGAARVEKILETAE